VKRRLELLVAALYGDAPSMQPSDAAPAPTWLARLMGHAPAHLTAPTALAGTDGVCAWLPRTLDAADGVADAAAAYRLLAIEQTARLRRGTAALGIPDRLEHDLYLLAEALAVDADLACQFPGVTGALRIARTIALRRRPVPAALTPLEAAVEGLVQSALASDPATPPAEIPLAASPQDSLGWARATAARLRGTPGRYRGMAPVAPWGELRPPAPRVAVLPTAAPAVSPREQRPRRALLRRRPRVRAGSEDEDDPAPGTWMIRPDPPMESAEDPKGLQRPADRSDPDAAELADSLSELPEARVVRAPGTPREVLLSPDAAVPRAPVPRSPRPDVAGIAYPEWDYRLAAYREAGATVRPSIASPGSGAWVQSVMVRHAALVRRVRHRFEGLRPRRLSLGRQDDGGELDLDAYVTAFADQHAGTAGDERLYVAARPARRDLLIALVVDASASTDSWVAGSARIIDVEKESLIVLLEALDALGDRHAALAFSGEGPHDVRLATLKSFEERVGLDVRRRVAGLEPDGYTRVGAAVRHASALLAGQAARHRLLLLLSDGKPNDVDQYEGRYGVEDTRQAVAEARVQGLVPFCLTVDRDAPAYMTAIFGPRGYAVLRRQELLPAVLVEVVRGLLVA